MNRRPAMRERTKMHETARFGRSAMHGNARESFRTRAFVRTVHRSRSPSRDGAFCVLPTRVRVLAFAFLVGAARQTAKGLAVFWPCQMESALSFSRAVPNTERARFSALARTRFARNRSGRRCCLDGSAAYAFHQGTTNRLVPTIPGLLRGARHDRRTPERPAAR
jgi:hypothetical protein